MTSRLHLLLAAACALALIQLASGQMACNVTTWGVKNAPPQHLDMVQLAPNLRQWSVTFPKLSDCQEIIGAEIIVCDDKEAKVTIIDGIIAKIFRRGRIQLPASVYITVHCKIPESEEYEELPIYAQRERVPSSVGGQAAVRPAAVTRPK
ncbi:uncharacterized protein LOC142985301 [Anticarsia gemmatalis]|uniref:uncharacterized protein LOC142985301 n=1 Tax=Anticarsia gemmatalis TaxID=129554 RepID=UPI003F7581B1